MEFTIDWAGSFRSNLRKYFRRFLNKANGKKQLRWLELGVFEGRGGCWVLDRYPFLTYTGIDSWELAELNPKIFPEGSEVRVAAVRHRAHRNLLEAGGSRVRILTMRTLQGLAKLASEEQKFDFIYIDASHHAVDVIVESGICWPLLELGGCMLWDDYRGGGPRNTVKKGVNAFLSCLPRGSYKAVCSNHQLGVQKTGEADSHPLFRAAASGKAVG